MQKRKEQRKQSRLKVLFGEHNCENVGFTSNISKGGMYIESDSSRSFDRAITMMLAADDRVFKLKGEVRWRMESPTPGNHTKVTEGMGVRIVDAPPEYLNFVEYRV